MKYITFISLFLAILPMAHSTWFQAQGNAPVVAGDKDTARQNAAKDALRQIILKSGASFSSLQTLDQGILIKDKFIMRAHGDIQMTQVLSEYVENERFFMTLRAFVTQDNSECKTLPYKKTISMTRFKLAQVQDLSDGALVNFPQFYSQYLYDRLGHDNKYIHTLPWLDYHFDLDPAQLMSENTQTQRKIQQIGQQTHSQYLLMGMIDDLSITYPENFFQRWTIPPVRHFKLRFYLFDNLTGKIVHTGYYATKANWTFKAKLRLHTTNAAFWQSPFGQEIQHINQKIIEEINSALACEKPKGQIIQVNESSIRINLGRYHGLTTGQTLFIEYQSQLRALNQHFPVRQIHDTPFTITQLFDNTAILSPQGFMPNNIQVNDWVLLEKEFED